MKILKLKFKNINSLSGENEINFSQPEFLNDGLFAITGKTGSGKSTILDAISLAIYGKTPRVEITANDNAVMTRGEKDCYAEIVFEVAGKKWKSSWKQELNRNGKLKPVNRQIADYEDKIVADQVRSCDKKIVEIIGLTFEQFTKVIMLAQGSFAAFLQADKNDKGQLLEQITGTEIYGEISKKVFDRSKTEREKLDKILIEINAIKILSEEEITKISEETKNYEAEKKQIDTELKSIEKAKNWITDLQNLTKQIEEAKQKLPELKKNLDAVEITFDKAKEELSSAKIKQEKQEPIFLKVRELDTKISEKDKLQKPISATISDLENRSEKLEKILENQNDNLGKTKSALSEKQHWINQNKLYEELIANYATIEKENDLLSSNLSEITKLNDEISELQKNFDSGDLELEKIINLYKEKDKSVNSKITELEEIKSELNSILNNKEITDYQYKKEKIIEIGTHLKNLQETENSIEKNTTEIENFDKKINRFSDEKQTLLDEITKGKTAVENLESKINLLEENIQLANTIRSLEEHRNNLKDGEVCPLCGAKEHPFAIGNIPKLDEKEAELINLKKIKKQEDETLAQNKNKHVKLVSDNDNILKNKEKEEKEYYDNLKNKKEIIVELKNIGADFSLSETEQNQDIIQEKIIEKRNELLEINKVLEQALKLEKQIKNLRDEEIPKLQEEKKKSEENKNKLESDQKLSSQKINDKKDLLSGLQEKYNAEIKNFNKKLEKYSAENIVALKHCLNLWVENKKQEADLEKEVNHLESNILLNKKEWDNQLKSLEEKREELNGINKDKKRLTDEREKIFGTKSVEEEEINLKKALQNAENQKNESEAIKNKTYTEYEKNKAIIAEKEKDFAEKREEKVTEKSLEELQYLLDEKKIKADEWLQKIGANNRILELNKENNSNNISKLEEKEQQQNVSNQWAKLNELIGSADGKKYRNFAQALTFEHLIGLANKQLQKMSDRYILKRTGDVANPFELSVIDKFQNNEERTAQNLSGGEKFIISLSLALGLANMAGKNMQIDTMFIDEGFGTLDSDYLDVALSALSNLQSEGKIIGVISHLTELKERIATHVEVVPIGNGHSKIQVRN